MRDAVSVVIAGHEGAAGSVAELWCGSAFLGTLHEENGAIVLHLEAHARGPLSVSALALERALGEARERLAGVCHASAPRPVFVVQHRAAQSGADRLRYLEQQGEQRS